MSRSASRTAARPALRSGAPVTRRSFLLGSTATLAAPLALRFRPRRSPNELLQVAHVGVGGMGASDLGSVASSPHVRIVALCDVDAQHLGAAAARHDGARTFSDYRVLLDELSDDIDAVVVSTPDHMHAPIALAAMELGKHVYVQKPLAHDLHGCRRLREVAARTGVVTQMGTQIHAHAAYRTAVATLRAGAIGKVREVHSWVAKSWAGPATGRPDHSDPVPASLAWDRWLGVAPERPFVAGVYHPARWRGWRDFGTGTLGDMACHLLDPIFTALDLRVPLRATSRGPAHGRETFAPDGDVTFVLAGTAHTADTVMLRWTDGSATSRPDASRAQLPDGVALPGAGSFLVGEDGVMVLPHWATPTLYRHGEPHDAPLHEEAGGDHYHEWVDACRGEGETSTPFAFATAVTETVLLGVVAGALPSRELTWDSAALRFADDDAQALVELPHRAGHAH
ncbi:MAG: Gfo/Idh/MocA family oxidoreductase [Planctomycetes bacterium]|nr:Gfo/Idh/MocA family oxidoreductase [Planctomycetota bacterium]